LRSEFARGDRRLDGNLLEVAATIYFLVKHTFGYISDSDERLREARKWVEENKPELRDRVQDATQHLRSLGMLG